jgi:prevent-host-death family protein
MAKPIRAKSATLPFDAATSVGVRELRDHLSVYLGRVKAGETLTITEHGRPIATLIGRGLPPSLLALVARGEATLPTRPLSDLLAVRGVPYDGDVQALIDEIRG